MNHASPASTEPPIKKSRPWVLTAFTIAGIFVSSIFGIIYIDSYSTERRALFGLPSGYAIRSISLSGQVQMHFEQLNVPFIGLLTSSAEELNGETIARLREDAPEMYVYEMDETNVWPVKSFILNNARIVLIDFWLVYIISIGVTVSFAYLAFGKWRSVVKGGK